MTYRFSRFGLLLVLWGALSLTGVAHAQGDAAATNDGQAAQQSATDDAAATNNQDQDEDAGASAADENTDDAAAGSDNPDDAPVGDSPARFIPTEQVSQDLGVSFPADI